MGEAIAGRDPGVIVRTPSRAVARCRCRTGPALRAHHDRLLRVEGDHDALLDLLELAVTWGELDWSSEDVLRPEQWSELVENHRWRNVERVRRLFGLAQDIAARGDGSTTGPQAVPATAVMLAGQL